MIIEPLGPQHNRFGFSCGNDKLDRYLHEVAGQANKKKTAATFVAVDEDKPSEILGYYSLSSYSISGLQIPDVLRKKRGLPTHTVGATLLQRLAVAERAQGRGIGPKLLANALQRSYRVSGDIASTCVVVDAIEPDKVSFYEKFGFEQVETNSLKLVLMMDTVAQLMPSVATVTDKPEAV